MTNREKQYQDYLRKAGLEFLKMNVKSPVVLLNAAKEVVLGGKTRFVKYNENELIYDIKPTKLGELKKDLKNKDTRIIHQLYYELNKGAYPNKPFQGMLIERLDKPDKPRLIKVPAVSDRIVYTLLLKRIESFFEDDVKNYPIYGLTGKGVSLAIRKLVSVISDESVVLKLDFQSYFDTIPRGKLLEKMRRYKIGGEELRLIKAAINAPTNIPKTPRDLSKKHGHKFKPYETKIGLPQGCTFSPLLASIYALDVERYLKNNDIPSIRYIDDIIIIVESIDEARRIYKDLDVICTDLGLTIHKPKENEVNDKSYIAEANQPIRFLGLDICNGIATLPKDKMERFYTVLIERLSEKLTREDDLKYRDDCIRSFIVGWTRYYREHAEDWDGHKGEILEKAITIVNASDITDTTKTTFVLSLRKEFGK